MFEVDVTGMAEANKKIQDLINSLHRSKVEPVLMNGAKMMSRTARAKAPVRRTQGSGSKPPGVLKGAIKTKQLARLFSHPATAISAIDRKIAPHAHLVHEGTGERIGGPKSKRYRGRRFGSMPANPFFQEAWDETRMPITDYIVKTLSNMVKGAV